MSNLSIENIAGGLNSSSPLGSGIGGPGAASEQGALKEMLANGMDAPAPAGGSSFSQMLSSSLEKVNTDQHQADSAIKEMVAGRSKNIHETMLTVERADASLKMMMQVRNKILEAYKEVMRMQV